MSTITHGARIREAYPSLALEVRNQRDMESLDQLLAGELDLATREDTGASSATAAVTRLLKEAGRKVG